MLVSGIITTTLWSARAGQSAAVQGLAFGVPALRTGRWSTFWLGSLVLKEPLLYVLVIPLIAVVVGLYERRVGTLRAAATVVLTHLVGTLGSAMLVHAMAGGDWPWVNTLSTNTDLGLSAAGFGVLAAASALAPSDWRRRIRVVIGTYLVVMVLRSGLLWDLEHLLAFGAGLMIGPLLTGAPIRASTRLWVGNATPRVGAALLLVTLAISTLVQAIFPGIGGAFGDGDTATAPFGSSALVLGAVTVLLADALRRGRAAAYWICLVGIGVVLAGDIGGLLCLAPVDVGLGLVALGLLVLTRPTTAIRLVEARTFLRRIALSMVVVSVATTGTLFVLQSHTLPTFDLESVLAEIIARLSLGSGPFAGQMDLALSLISIGWVVAVLAILARVLYAVSSGGQIEQPIRFRQLLTQHGGGSLGWHRTWIGFTSWISSDSSVAVAFRVELGVAIALGDPVGPRAGWASAVTEFEAFTRSRGWTPVWYAVTSDFGAARTGARLLQIGEDTTIELASLSFTGRAWQDVRTARNRADRDGIVMVRGQLAALDPSIRAQVAAISSHWVGQKSLPEMGFTLGGLDEALDPEVQTHVAVDTGGRVHAFTTWLPIHRDGAVVGYTLDVMRRHESGFRPVMEFLIAQSALSFQASGLELMSLSVAPLARRTTAAAGALEHGLDRISALLESAYGFRSLMEFKAKFQPVFTPVYLGYTSDLDLPDIALAISHAYVPHVSLRQARDLAIDLLPRTGQRLRRRALR